MVIVVNGRLEDERDITKYIEKHYLPNRLTLCLYLMHRKHPHGKNFPVNYLRNLAIRNVATTHYMIMDMDMWPTGRGWHPLISSEYLQ